MVGMETGICMSIHWKLNGDTYCNKQKHRQTTKKKKKKEENNQTEIRGEKHAGRWVATEMLVITYTKHRLCLLRTEI